MQRGFSLFELLVVIAIVAIIISVRFTHYLTFYQHNNEQVVKRQFIAGIEQAREMARTSHQRTIFCATSNGESCDNENSAEVIGFVDTHSDAKVHDKQQIFFLQTLNLAGKIFWRTFPRYRDYLLFDPTGFLHSDNGSIWYCAPADDRPKWMLAINKTARIHEVSPNIKCSL